MTMGHSDLEDMTPRNAHDKIRCLGVEAKSAQGLPVGLLQLRLHCRFQSSLNRAFYEN